MHLSTKGLWEYPSQIGFKIPDVGEPQYYKDSECRILDGRVIAKNLVAQCHRLKEHHPLVIPKLVAILVGDHAPSKIYVGRKMKAFEEAGFASKVIEIPEKNVSLKGLNETIEKLNQDPLVHGILVQLPLPDFLDTHEVIHKIHPSKDVDGFLDGYLAQLALGRFPPIIPCTALGVGILLQCYGISMPSQHVVVIGRSRHVGRPCAWMALNQDATLTLAHSKTQDLPNLLKTADVIISATGNPWFIQPEFLKSGAVGIDVGISQDTDKKIKGDFHPNCQKKLKGLSPVPGGVGPLTVAMLCVNTAILAWKK